MMKEKVTIKEGGWYWPADDMHSFKEQKKNLDLYDAIAPYLRGNKMMIQAGGNCGLLLNTFVDKFETIYTFEPESLNFYCLNQNVTSENVIKMQACLGYERTPVNVKHLDNWKDIGGSHVSGAGKIPMISIDSLNLDGCDLIQLDVEGYELNALIGAKETVLKYKPVICVEFYEPWAARYGNTCSQLEDFILSLGYTRSETVYNQDNIFIPVV